jgi:hypothetical protein
MGTPNYILDGLPMILIEEFKPRTGGEIGVVFHVEHPYDYRQANHHVSYQPACSWRIASGSRACLTY